METDSVFGIFYGDEGKSKVVADLVKNNGYTHVLRFNGSSNAGHTWYYKGTKIVSHMIPTGIPYGATGIIGPGCVLNVDDFFGELALLEKISPGCSGKIKIAKNTHIVTTGHRDEEIAESKLGTTRKGVGPAYRDKYARVGIRAEDVAELKPFLVDLYDLFYTDGEIKLLCEGAQATGLDIDWTPQYPYCTSSHCGLGGVINNGVPISSIRQIYGVVKSYNTYVGTKSFQDKSDPVLDKIGDVGGEYGATTGRRRLVNYFDCEMLVRGCAMNSVTKLVVNKMDILQEVGVWKVIENGIQVDLKDEESFKKKIRSLVPSVEVIFSYSAEMV